MKKANLIEQMDSCAGLYSVQDAARYADVSLSKLKRWFYGDYKSDAVLEPLITDDRDYLTFYDFVEALAIKELRSRDNFIQYAIPLQKIRKAINDTKNIFKIDYPLAMLNRVGYDGRNLHIQPDGFEYPVQATGKEMHQQSLLGQELNYIRWIDFDHDTKMALRYRHPIQYCGKSIILDPRRMMGEPFVEGCPISAPTLYDAYVAEGSDEQVSKYFNVDAQYVTASRNYCESLQMAA